MEHAIRRYPASPAVALRGMGVGAAGLGAVLVLWLVLRAIVGERAGAVAVDVVLGVVAAALLALTVVAVWRSLNRRPLLELGTEEWVNRTSLFGGGRRGTWAEVTRAESGRRAGRNVVVLHLRDGRRSVVDADVIGADVRDLARELAARLNKGHGYRPL